MTPKEIMPGRLYEIGWEDRDPGPGSCVMHNTETGRHAWIDCGEIVLVLAALRKPGDKQDMIHPDHGVARILYGNCVYDIDAYFLTKAVG